jgi:alkaline phosphatase D
MKSAFKHSRRYFLQTAAPAVVGSISSIASILSHAQAPALVTSERLRPQLLHGVQSGDTTYNSSMVWARTDRESKMWVEWDTEEKFTNPRTIAAPYALEDTDFTARIDLNPLPSGEDIFYRVRFEGLRSGAMSGDVQGHFRTPHRSKKSIRFLWSGDTAGQGWGINPEQGGMTTYEVMRSLNPDFFIHSGDNIYADGPIKSEVLITQGPLKGMIWKNIVTEEKSKVAETLNEFRGNFRYNMMDHNVRRFNSEVSQIWQWDDHEVLNNYSVSKDIANDQRYKEKSVSLLTARARKAFLEYAPMRWNTQTEEQRIYRKLSQGPLLDVFVIDMRSYRGGNSFNRQETSNADSQYLGARQLEWLKRELKSSKAVWKIIAADMPIGLQVEDGFDKEGRPSFEAVANGDGPALGRELEIAELLSFIKNQKIRNTVWITADTHYTAAHYYNPKSAIFKDFDPFWEFMSGPLSSGTFGPNKTDNTFGIEVKFQKHPEQGRVNLCPAEGLQFFGDIQIDAKTAHLNVDLRDMKGHSLWSTYLLPRWH